MKILSRQKLITVIAPPDRQNSIAPYTEQAAPDVFMSSILQRAVQYFQLPTDDFYLLWGHTEDHRMEPLTEGTVDNLPREVRSLRIYPVGSIYAHIVEDGSEIFAGRWPHGVPLNAWLAGVDDANMKAIGECSGRLPERNVRLYVLDRSTDQASPLDWSHFPDGSHPEVTLSMQGSVTLYVTNVATQERRQLEMSQRQALNDAYDQLTAEAGLKPYDRSRFHLEAFLRRNGEIAVQIQAAQNLKQARNGDDLLLFRYLKVQIDGKEPLCIGIDEPVGPQVQQHIEASADVSLGLAILLRNERTIYFSPDERFVDLLDFNVPSHAQSESIPAMSVRYKRVTVQYRGDEHSYWLTPDIVLSQEYAARLAAGFDDREANRQEYNFFLDSERGPRQLGENYSFTQAPAQCRLRMEARRIVDIRHEQNIWKRSVPLDAPIAEVGERVARALLGEGIPVGTNWSLTLNQGSERRQSLNRQATLRDYNLQEGDTLFLEEFVEREVTILVGNRVHTTLCSTRQRLLDAVTPLLKDYFPNLGMDSNGRCLNTGFLIRLYREPGAQLIEDLSQLVQDCEFEHLRVRVWVWTHLFMMNAGATRMLSGWTPAELEMRDVLPTLQKRMGVGKDYRVVNISNWQQALFAWNQAAWMADEARLMDEGATLRGVCLLLLVSAESLSMDDWLLVP